LVCTDFDNSPDDTFFPRYANVVMMCTAMEKRVFDVIRNQCSYI